MLSDAEQRRLTEIELSLMAGDPRLARRFDRSWRRRTPSMIAMVCLVLLSWIATVSALASGSFGIAVIGLVAMVVTAIIWAARRRR